MSSKFKFKIQQYQTDAVSSVIDVFKRQPYLNATKYTRNLGGEKNTRYTKFAIDSASNLLFFMRNLRNNKGV